MSRSVFLQWFFDYGLNEIEYGRTDNRFVVFGHIILRDFILILALLFRRGSRLCSFSRPTVFALLCLKQLLV